MSVQRRLIVLVHELRLLRVLHLHANLPAVHIHLAVAAEEGDTVFGDVRDFHIIRVAQLAARLRGLPVARRNQTTGQCQV